MSAGTRGWMVDFFGLVELTEAAAELGGMAPSDEYLENYDGASFVLIPTAQMTPSELQTAVIPYDQDSGRWLAEPTLPDDLTVEQFFDVVEGQRQPDAAVQVVFLEVDIATTHELELFEHPVPPRIARFLQQQGLLYVARIFDSWGYDVQAELARRAANSLEGEQ